MPAERGNGVQVERPTGVRLAGESPVAVGPHYEAKRPAIQANTAQLPIILIALRSPARHVCSNSELNTARYLQVISRRSLARGKRVLANARLLGGQAAESAKSSYSRPRRLSGWIGHGSRNRRVRIVPRLGWLGTQFVQQLPHFSLTRDSANQVQIAIDYHRLAPACLECVSASITQAATQPVIRRPSVRTRLQAPPSFSNKNPPWLWSTISG